ncbi:hypothetical protein TYRP_016601 [Tyrophagus putrescentiae]|nr:hypothetical protein TYRP_016601 [Tyrophagus putrescentiae]
MAACCLACSVAETVADRESATGLYCVVLLLDCGYCEGTGEGDIEPPPAMAMDELESIMFIIWLELFEGSSRPHLTVAPHSTNLRKVGQPPSQRRNGALTAGAHAPTPILLGNDNRHLRVILRRTGRIVRLLRLDAGSGRPGGGNVRLLEGNLLGPGRRHHRRLDPLP